MTMRYYRRVDATSVREIRRSEATRNDLVVERPNGPMLMVESRTLSPVDLTIVRELPRLSLSEEEATEIADEMLHAASTLRASMTRMRRGTAARATAEADVSRATAIAERIYRRLAEARHG